MNELLKLFDALAAGSYPCNVYSGMLKPPIPIPLVAGQYKTRCGIQWCYRVLYARVHSSEICYVFHTCNGNHIAVVVYK